MIVSQYVKSYFENVFSNLQIVVNLIYISFQYFCPNIVTMIHVDSKLERSFKFMWSYENVISWEPFKLVWSQFDSLTYINMQSNMILQEYRHRKSLS